MYRVKIRIVDWYRSDMTYKVEKEQIFNTYKQAYKYYSLLQGKNSDFYPRSYYECLITN